MSLVARLDKPRRPTAMVDTDLPAGWDGAPWRTPVDSAAFQTALDDVPQNAGLKIIRLNAGTTYTGNFYFNQRAGNDHVIIISSGWASSPPVAEGTRVAPSDASNMATLAQTGTSPVFRVGYGAHHIRLIGIEFSTGNATISFVLVGFNGSEQAPTQPSEIAQYIGFDRCYIHSTSETNKCQTGIQADADHFFCIASYISNIKDTADAQAIIIKRAYGPFHIENNFLEATGENFMSGGGDTAIYQLVPSDLTFCRNYCSKPDKWNPNHGDFNGIPGEGGWGVKNNFEIKTGRRFWIWGNVFEGCWASSQIGQAILFTVRNQEGGNRWATIDDVLFENNIVRNTRMFLNILSDDTEEDRYSDYCRRWTIRNNLAYNIGGSSWGPNGSEHMINYVTEKRPLVDALIEHNTLVPTEGHLINSINSFGTGKVYVDRWRFRNNLFNDNEFPWDGKLGVEALNYTVEGNGFFFDPAANDYANRINDGNFASTFPGNTKANTIALVKFTDNDNQDYTLQNDSPFRGAASDGRDCGVDFFELNAAIAGVVQ